MGRGLSVEGVSEFAYLWEQIEAARIAEGKKLEKLWAAIGSTKGKKFSRSTWHSYKRWCTGTGKGPRTSPTVWFLSRVADLLRLTLVLDLRSGATLSPSRGHEGTGVKDIDAVVEWMLRLGPEARHEVREAAMRKIAELASLPPEGDDDNGRRPPPK